MYDIRFIPTSRRPIYLVLRYQAADAPKVSEYLHSTYDGFKLPPPQCGSTILDFFDGLYRGVTALFPIPATPHCFQIELDDGEYRVRRVLSMSWLK